jgi:hypothetical protein
MNPGGTRQGKVVLAQHRSIDDAELGGKYTVKVYRSEKVAIDSDSWKHKRVILSPDSTDPFFSSLEFWEEDSDVVVIAEMGTVLA